MAHLRAAVLWLLMGTLASSRRLRRPHRPQSSSIQPSSREPRALQGRLRYAMLHRPCCGRGAFTIQLACNTVGGALEPDQRALNAHLRLAVLWLRPGAPAAYARDPTSVSLPCLTLNAPTSTSHPASASLCSDHPAALVSPFLPDDEAALLFNSRVTPSAVRSTPPPARNALLSTEAAWLLTDALDALLHRRGFFPMPTTIGSNASSDLPHVPRTPGSTFSFHALLLTPPSGRLSCSRDSLPKNTLRLPFSFVFVQHLSPHHGSNATFSPSLTLYYVHLQALRKPIGGYQYLRSSNAIRRAVGWPCDIYEQVLEFLRCAAYECFSDTTIIGCTALSTAMIYDICARTHDAFSQLPSYEDDWPFKALLKRYLRNAAKRRRAASYHRVSLTTTRSSARAANSGYSIPSSILAHKSSIKIGGDDDPSAVRDVPIYWGKAHGYRLRVHPDTGKERTYITYPAAQRIGATLRCVPYIGWHSLVDDVRLMRFDDGSLWPCHAMAHFTTNLGGMKQDMSAFVVDSTICGVDLILGTRWLRKHRGYHDWFSEVASSGFTSPSVVDSNSEEEIIIKMTGPWSREAFARKIVEEACLFGDDYSLATIMNDFPRVGVDDARLWLAYMKDLDSRGGPCDYAIMDSFRSVPWTKLFARNAGDAAQLEQLSAKVNGSAPNVPLAEPHVPKRSASVAVHSHEAGSADRGVNPHGKVVNAIFGRTTIQSFKIVQRFH
ncbi:hypothetical protein AURDEDRAFT_177542 [Auricularia subglabra TFB-10046 SS5]|uniref:Uncharacterized protein n=1 Tax=Auricularia subglabra (strain TFB-10046 / SS5) TaxID=717982 RepID=J0WNE9_AURST|nr:hypothetical protein AURDEDRAFT_177542 [Auricularia subglabra TFB-10046 SS5]